MAAVEQEGWSGVHINKELVAKIEKFINTDQAYTDVIRNSALFNRRLAADRKMRLPYYDAQTGVAQSCTSLWMDPRQRMPGKDEGQIYTYPAKTWVKRRRQYLIAPPKKDMMEGEDAEVLMKIEETRDVIAKDEGASKEPWYYEDNEDGLEFDDPDLESDDDYYTDSSRSKRKKRALPMIKTPKRDSGSRSKKKASAPVPPEPINEADKPYACALCPARYKTRPGLTYHYAHSHKDQPRPPIEHPSTLIQAPELDIEESSSPMDFDEAGRLYRIGRPAPVRSRPVPIAVRVPSPMVDTPKRKAAVSPPRMNPGSPPPPTLVPQVQTPVVPHPQMVPATSRQQAPPQQGPSPYKDPKGDAPKAAPSPFCDFCLGDAVNNKKTGSSEELVSCSDCGRSGHPSCLQFTVNMMVSVRKYRWQCIECKCCTLCGTSDNDEQLLFCDDCDRGYHMYCLKPPLSEPPEGSWSCHLCVREFHK